MNKAELFNQQIVFLKNNLEIVNKRSRCFQLGVNVQDIRSQKTGKVIEINPSPYIYDQVIVEFSDGSFGKFTLEGRPEGQNKSICLQLV